MLISVTFSRELIIHAYLIIKFTTYILIIREKLNSLSVLESNLLQKLPNLILRLKINLQNTTKPTEKQRLFFLPLHFTVCNNMLQVDEPLKKWQASSFSLALEVLLYSYLMSLLFESFCILSFRSFFSLFFWLLLFMYYYNDYNYINLWVFILKWNFNTTQMTHDVTHAQHSELEITFSEFFSFFCTSIY